MVLSPDKPYTDARTERLREFVRRGGTLVIAEDFGPNDNALLEGVGASTGLVPAFRSPGEKLEFESLWSADPVLLGGGRVAFPIVFVIVSSGVLGWVRRTILWDCRKPLAPI